MLKITTPSLKFEEVLDNKADKWQTISKKPPQITVNSEHKSQISGR